MQEILAFGLFIFAGLLLIQLILWLVDKITDMIMYKNK